MNNKFKLQAPFKPAGDQPQAITKLTEGLSQGLDKQTLMGVTGSGKTMTMASVIAQTNKPALVISHNKTLAAQLANEFRLFFPDNAVEYFVSYYDYYQPEAYLPRSDTYIAKDAGINDEIDRLRHSALASVLTRSDVIIVASVSCIYGLGSPQEYLDKKIFLQVGESLPRRDLIKKLNALQYTRNDTDLIRGTFRVRGDIIDIHPAGEDRILRLEAFGSKIEQLAYLDPLTGEVIESVPQALIFPATFYLASPEHQARALGDIRKELATQLTKLKKQDRLLEAQRLEQRTTYDLEMIEQIGYVSGIENYSLYFDNRSPGQAPYTLIDYFKHSYGDRGFLTFVDESHMTIPQIGAMSGGDKARKENLVRYGFRLPSALDNRPLKFSEFEDKIGSEIFVTATPAKYEHNTSQQTVEQIIRPTGLLDPTIDIRPLEHQVDDIIDEIQATIKKKQRVLVTTLTKRLSEELSTYLIELGIKAAYLHSDIATMERIEILRDLRLGRYDVLVGINLLREGLDLPEVSLIAILDADKEGYLRSSTALVQTMGRAARHQEGHVIMYADRVTGSMEQAISETNRRRKIQQAHNKLHNITPRTITKEITASRIVAGRTRETDLPDEIPDDEIRRLIKEWTSKMDLASRNLDFEEAARYRDLIKQLRKK